MTTDSEPRAPAHLLAGGRALWSSVTGDYELAGHERAVLLRAAEVVDALDDLQHAINESGRVVDGRPNACLVEHRQQSALLSRLLASLRLPEDDDEQAVRESKVKQAQRRGGARSPYQNRQRV